MNVLDPATIELSGRRLIEASAGTGKTFNITRLYLRALLEQNRKVQNILVLTFTEAATDELKQRIAAYLQEVISEWWGTGDVFLKSVQERVDMDSAYKHLQLSLLEIDDASIFTIHGFCQRLLTQYATSFQYSSDAEVIQDTRRIVLGFLADNLVTWRKDEALFAQLEAKNLITPESLLKEFSDVFYKDAIVEFTDSQELAKDLVKELGDAWSRCINEREVLSKFIKCNKELFLDGMARNPKNETVIYQQLDVVTQWLEKPVNDYLSENITDFYEAAYAFDNARAEKCVLLPALKTIFETRKKKYQTEFSEKVTEYYKPLKIGLLSGLRHEGSVILNKIHKLPIYKKLLPDLMLIKKKLNQHFDKNKSISFNYMIEKVSHHLRSISDNNKLLEDIREQFPIAMVDEFQDTDNLQFSIFDRLYPPKSNAHCLLMIGDPKQAIYAFRGGDVFTYIEARDSVDEYLTMDVNWRSSNAMVNAVNGLFSSLPESFLGPNIKFQPVRASVGSKAQKAPWLERTERKRIDDSLHVVFSDQKTVATTGGEEFSHKIELIKWMAEEIITLLTETGFESSSDNVFKPLEPKDIAILVRTGYEAALIRNELKKYDLDTVYLSERTPLFASKQAQDTCFALSAILHMDKGDQLRAGISTGLLVNDKNIEIDAILRDDTHPDWQLVIAHIVELKSIWLSDGLYSAMYAIIRRSILPQSQIDRSFANLMHLAEEFAQLEVTVSNPYEQLKWLQQQLLESENHATELRLESDKALIKIVTQHKAKGLEYPVVFIPFANAGARTLNQSVYPYHDENNRLRINLGFSFKASNKAKSEYFEENMRLLYVAMTRSLYRCYLGIVVSNTTSTSALQQMLGLEDLRHESDAEQYRKTFKATTLQKCKQVTDNIVFRTASNTSGKKYRPEVTSSKIECQNPTRSISALWQMSSFSRITKMSEASLVQTREDEGETISSVATLGVKAKDNVESSLLRFELTPGAETGNLLHDFLEHVDFQSQNFTDVWSKISGQHLWFEHQHFDNLVLWLKECLAAPILPNGLRMQDLTNASVLKEPNFYMPSIPLDGNKVCLMLNQHRQRVADTYRLEDRRAPFVVNQNSNLVVQGFIDLIFESEGKYYVVDYKSSMLGKSFSDYSREQMWSNMQSHSYDLQYHFYVLALHRMLEQRIEKYEPKKHLGGVIYTYLRGMSIENRGQGIFYVPPDTIDIEHLDALLDGDS